MTGTTILHYKIGERLGAGGMGEVYRAEDLRLGRPVALKFLSEAARADAQARARLLREARAASVLRSPHIAVTYDIAEHDGGMFIVMEYVEGEVLSQRLARGPLAVKDAVNIAMQIADALDEAHTRGVLHRDVKSSNVMITERQLVKVLDFGLAKFIEPPGGSAARSVTLHETMPGLLLGTLSYMSPEQVLGRPVDHRSDIFSLGVVLYEMLAGRLPFEGDSLTEIIDRIINHEPAALARFNYGVGPEIESIVRKSLEKDPDFRYQTARELYIDLHNAGRNLESVERPAASRRLAEMRTGASRARRTDVAARDTGSHNAVAVMTFSNITREPADEWIGEGIAETVTADLKKIEGLAVVGRAQIFDAVKNLSSGDLPGIDERLAIDIGRRIGARWIVAGGYQRIGDGIRITAHFVDVSTGALVQTVKVDGKIGEIFALQDKIVYELSRGLNLQLAHSEIEGIETDETRSVEAYQAYSRGVMNLRMAGRDSIDRAIYLFEKAIEHDPEYPAAWARLGEAYGLKGGFLSIPELVEKGRESVRRAVALNPRFAMARALLGAGLAASGQVDEGIAELQEAIRLDPDNGSAIEDLGRVYWLRKGAIDEGIAQLERAVELNPEGGYAYLQLGFLYTLKGDYARAEAACRAAIDLQKQYISGKEGLLIVGAHTRLGYVYYRQGRYDEAIRAYERELAFLSSSDHVLRDRSLIEVNQKLGAAYSRKGMPEEAGRYFQRALKEFDDRLARGADDPFTRYYIATLHAVRGEVEPAVRSLRETLGTLPALNVQRVRTDPDFDAIREHPAFIELIQKVKKSKS